jgi:hypothetical protein
MDFRQTQNRACVVTSPTKLKLANYFVYKPGTKFQWKFVCSSFEHKHAVGTMDGHVSPIIHSAQRTPNKHQQRLKFMKLHVHLVVDLRPTSVLTDRS